MNVRYSLSFTAAVRNWPMGRKSIVAMPWLFPQILVRFTIDCIYVFSIITLPCNKTVFFRNLVNGFSLTDLKSLLLLNNLNVEMHNRLTTTQKSKARSKSSKSASKVLPPPMDFGVNDHSRRVGKFMTEVVSRTVAHITSSSSESPTNSGHDAKIHSNQYSCCLDAARLHFESGISDEYVLTQDVVVTSIPGRIGNGFQLKNQTKNTPSGLSLRKMFSPFLTHVAKEECGAKRVRDDALRSTSVATDEDSFRESKLSCPKPSSQEENHVADTRIDSMNRPPLSRDEGSTTNITNDVKLNTRQQSQQQPYSGSIEANVDIICDEMEVDLGTKPSSKNKRKPPQMELENEEPIVDSICLSLLPRRKWLGKIVYHQPSPTTRPPPKRSKKDPKKKHKKSDAGDEVHVGGMGVLGRVVNFTSSKVQIVDPFEPYIPGR